MVIHDIVIQSCIYILIYVQQFSYGYISVLQIIAATSADRTKLLHSISLLCMLMNAISQETTTYSLKLTSNMTVFSGVTLSTSRGIEGTANHNSIFVFVETVNLYFIMPLCCSHAVLMY